MSLPTSLLAVLLLLLLDTSRAGERLFKLKPRLAECGPPSCPSPQPGLTTVHLVPHSHDDTGWLKNVDEYYYGAKPDVQRAGVQYILESVVKELAKDPEKKFIQVETGFFWRWWEDKDDFMRNLTRTLVDAGQLEFTGGGWSMNDEATTHYSSIIDNMEFGLNWLVDNLGQCAVPTVAWQIDPFGHSKEQARLFAEMGFEGLFFARIDYRDKEERKGSQSLQMFWEGGQEDDLSSTIFTGVFDSHYSNPAGFCWDILCTDEPINDDPDLDEWNVEQKMQQFENYVIDHLRYYKDQDHIMFTMGDDFQYQNAVMNYKNMDKLILHMNERSATTGLHLTYSTPSCYLAALRQNTDKVYPYKSDDFFPYASGSHSYWTGYFSSRPALKKAEREGARDLAVCRQLGLAGKAQGDQEPEFNMHRAMGLMQHHDAVTGTEKQNVADDYSQRLSRASSACQEENIKKVVSLSGLDPGSLDLSQTSCPGLNVSQCLVSESSSSFLVSLYNPLSWPVSPYIRLPVPSPSYSVHSVSGQLEVQAVPVPRHVREIPGRDSTAEWELVVRVPSVPGLGFTQLYVNKMEGEEGEVSVETGGHLHESVVSVKTVEQGARGLNVSGTQVNLEYYLGQQHSGQSSGAYIFRPDGSGRHELGAGHYSEVAGPLVNETTMEAGDWGVLSARSYRDLPYTELVWQVGPITGGKEAVVVFNSGLETNGLFFTDANGRQMVRRERTEGNLEPESSNYYPVTSRLELRPSGSELLAVVTDRAQGGASIREGELELMVHRRCERDDGFGVGEKLQEEAFGVGLVARGSHLLVRSVGQVEDLAKVRRLSQEQVLQPQLSFLATSLALSSWEALGDSRSYSALARELPSPVQVLTLSRWSSGRLLLRLQHTLDREEGGQPETVDLAGLFTEFAISSMQETTLAANQPLEAARPSMRGRGEGAASWEAGSSLVDLDPLQIRTFLATVVWN